MQPRQGEKRRFDDMIMDAREEGVVETLCRLGDGSPPGCGPALESDKRIRREIANSNERRRMQSINAGFTSLKQLLPNKDGEKLSKAAILQQTAEYIECLERENEELKASNKKLKKMVNHQESPDSSSSEGDVNELLSTLQDMRHHSKGDLPNTEFHSQPYPKKPKYDESHHRNTPPHRLSVSSPPHMIISNSPQHRLSTSSPPHLARKVYDGVVDEVVLPDGVVLPGGLDEKEEKYVITSEEDKPGREVYSGNRTSNQQITYTPVIKREIEAGAFTSTKAIVGSNNVRFPGNRTILLLPQSSPHSASSYTVGGGQPGSILEVVKGGRLNWVDRVPTPGYTTVVEQHPPTTQTYTSAVVEPQHPNTPGYTSAVVEQRCPSSLPRGPHPHIPPPLTHHPKEAATPRPDRHGQSSLETICEAIRHLEGENFHSSREDISSQEKIVEDKTAYVYEEDLVRQDRRDACDSERRILIEAYDAQSEDVSRSQPQQVRLEAYESQSEHQQIRLEAYDSQLDSQQVQDGYDSQPEQQQLLISSNSNAYSSPPAYLRTSLSAKHSPRYEISTGSSTSVVHSSNSPSLVYEHIEPQEVPLELTTRGSGRAPQSQLNNAYDSFSDRTNVIVIGK